MLAAVVLAGCTARHYRKAADKEVYGILQDVERRVFGETNAFTVETPYSGRKPKDIPPEEIIFNRSASNRMVLNLEQTLEVAVEHSREYQTQKEQLYLTALSLTGTRYEFSPQFFADVTPQITGTPGGSEVGSVRSRIGVGKLLRTGGSLTFSLANDLVRYFTGKPDFVSRDSAINTLSVDLTQPLLRGFGINDPLVEQLTQAERNVVYAVRSFSLYQQQFAVDTVNTYFDLLTQKDIVRNNYRNYTNRIETTRFLEARSEDRERRSSVDQARSEDLRARRDYINSLAGYMTALDSFKLRLGIPVGQELYLEDEDLEELIQAGLFAVDIDSRAAYALCLQKQMDVLNAIDRFEDSKRKVRVAADQLRMGVTLFGNATVSSEQPDDYLNFDPDNIRYTAGVRIDPPIDRLRERNNYRATLISFESQLRSLSLTLDNYKDRIERGLRTIEQARLNYLSGLESLRVAERRVDSDSMQLEAGRVSVRDLRESQDQLIEAQNGLAVLYADYLAARLGLMVNMGVLDTDQPKFWLQDPLKDLTPEQRSAPPLRMPDDQVIPPESFLQPST
jgi:outer membrane protein TolC